MLEERGFGILRIRKTIACHGARKCCAAIVLCLLPFAQKLGFCGAGTEASVVLCCKVNGAHEITHGIGSSIVSAPVFLWSLEERQCFIDFGSKFTSANGLSIERGTLFGEVMFEQSLSKIPQYTPKNSSKEESRPIHDFFTGLLFGFAIGIWIPAGLWRLKHNYKLSGDIAV